jgi:hypothetical protein
MSSKVCAGSTGALQSLSTRVVDRCCYLFVLFFGVRNLLPVADHFGQALHAPTRWRQHQKLVLDDPHGRGVRFFTLIQSDKRGVTR